MATVDSLSIQITASAKNAENSIDRLIGSLAKLQAAVSRMGQADFTSGFKKMSAGIAELNHAVASFDVGKLREINSAVGAFAKNAERMSDSAKKMSFNDISKGAEAFGKIAKQNAEDTAKWYGIKDVEAVKRLEKEFLELARAVNAADTEKIRSAMSTLASDLWNSKNVVKEFGQEYQSVMDNIRRANASGIKIQLPFKPSEFTDDYRSMRAQLGKAFTTSANAGMQNTMGFDSWLKGFSASDLATINAEMERLGLNSNSAASAFQALVSIARQYNDALKSGGAVENSANTSKEETKRIVYDLANEFQRLSAEFGKVNDIGGKNLTTTFDTLAREMNRLGEIRVPNIEELSKLTGILGRLGNLNLTNLESLNLGNASQQIKDFVNAMAGTEKIPARVSSLVSSLSRLANASNIGTVAEGLPALSAAVQDFMRSMASIPAANKGVTDFIDALSRLASVGNKAATTAGNLNTLAEALKRFMASMANAPAVNESVIRTIQALGSLGGATVNLGGAFGHPARQSSILVNTFQILARSSITLSKALGSTLTGALRLLGSTVGRSIGRLLTLNGALTSFIPGMYRAERATKGFVQQIGLFYAKFFLWIRLFKSLWKTIEDAMNSIEVVNYFNASVEQVTSRADLTQWKELGYKSAEAYAESFRERMLETTEQMSGYNLNEAGNLIQTGMKNFGIDSSILLNYQAQFAQMASSIGVSSDYATKISRAMTEIGADLASVKNMDFEDVWDNLSSGMTGMSRAVDKYGINIRNAALQTELANLGINATVQSLSQADKVMLRTIVILNASEYAWGDLSDTIQQPANQLRVLQNQFNMLGRAIGNIFLPIVAKVLPYLNQLVYALRELAEWIVHLLGYEDFDWGNATGANNEPLSALLDETEGVSDNLDEATEKAKEFKNQLQGFDKLNNLTSTDKSTPNSDNAADMANATGLLDAALDDALERYQKRWDEAFENMNQTFSTFAENVKKAYQEGGIGGVGEFFANEIIKGLNGITWDSYKSKVKGFGEKIGTFVAGLLKPNEEGDTLLGAVGTFIAEGINTAIALFDGWEAAFSKEAGWDNIGEGIAQYVGNIVDNIDWDTVESLAGRIGRGAARAINAFASSGSEPVSKIGKAAAKIIKAGINFWYNFVGEDGLKFKGLGKAIKNGINSFFKEMDVTDEEAGLSGWEKLGKSLTKTIGGLATALSTAISGSKIGKKMAKAIQKALKGAEFSDTGWKLGKLVKSLTREFYNLVKDPKTWTLLGKKIAAGINGFLKSMSEADKQTKLNGWQFVAKDISLTLVGFLESINTALEKVKWKKVGQAIADFIGAIEWGKVTWELLKLAKNLISALASTIAGLWENSSIIGKIAVAIGTVIGAVKLTGTALEAVKGLGIRMANSAIGKAFAEKLGINLAAQAAATEVTSAATSAGTLLGSTLFKALKVAMPVAVFLGTLFSDVEDVAEDEDERIKKIQKVREKLAKEFSVPVTSIEHALGELNLRKVSNPFNEDYDYDYVKHELEQYYEKNPIDGGEFISAGVKVPEIPSAVKVQVDAETTEKFDTTFKNLETRIHETSLNADVGTLSDRFNETSDILTKGFFDTKLNLDAGEKTDSYKKFVEDATGSKSMVVNADGGEKTESYTKFVDGLTKDTTLKVNVDKGKTTSQYDKFVEGLDKDHTTKLNADKGKTTKGFDSLSSDLKTKKYTTLFGAKQGGNTDGFNKLRSDLKVEKWTTKFGVNKVENSSAYTNTMDDLKEKIRNISVKIGASWSDGTITSLKNSLKNSFHFQLKSQYVNGTPTVSLQDFELSNAYHSSKKAMGGILKHGVWSGIKQYAAGGIPNRGTLFWAGEAGAEIVGNSSRGTEVLNQSQIAEAMAESMASANQEQNAYLRQQNALLREEIDVLHSILDKTGLTDSQVFSAVRRADRGYRNMNGHSAFVY